MEKIKILEIVIDAYWANANGSDGNCHILLTEDGWNNHHEMFEKNEDRPLIRVEEAGYVDVTDYAEYLRLSKIYAAEYQKMQEDMGKISDDFKAKKISARERDKRIVASGSNTPEYKKANKDVEEWLMKYMPRYDIYKCFFY
jgi:hypothetical protein